MNNDAQLLKEVAKFRDVVSLGVCSYIYQVCNGRQFKHMPVSDFVYFFNLKLPKEQVCVLPREKQRICYVILAVSKTVEPANYAPMWIEGVLDLCDISIDYYKKHNKDFLSDGASKEQREFCKKIDDCINRSR